MVAEAYWSSPAGITKTFELLKLLFYCSLGIFIYDTLLSAKFDWSIILGQRKRRWPQILYFGTKFFFTLFLALITMFFWLQSEADCRAVLISIQFAMGCTVAMSSALLACRTVCVFSGREKTLVIIILSVFGLGLVAAWMHGVEDVPAIWSAATASPWNTGSCVPVNMKKTYYVKYVVTIVFDLLVLVLTTVGILRVDASSRIGDILLKHGLIYFILTLIANLVVTILTALNLSPIMSLIAATPQSLICVIASTRLYRNLAEEAVTHVVSHQLSNDSRLSSFYKKALGNRRGNDDVIPVSSSISSSVDALEKGTNSMPKYNNTMSGVYIQQEQVMTSLVEPGYIRNHPFNDNSNNSDTTHAMPAMRNSSLSMSTGGNRTLQAKYPNLFSNK